MKKILFVNQKGGCGKSVLADETAFSFERSGIPVAFLDLDQQGGTLHATDQRADAEAAVIDTPGALQRQMGDWVRDADVIVIPTRTTSRDIDTLYRMMDIAAANAPGRPVVVVLNGWNRWRASRDFKRWLESQVGNGIEILTLPQSEKIVQAGTAGKSVAEYDRRSSAAKAMLVVVNRIRELAGFQPEKL